MTRIFEQRKNFDLRRLLGGSERLIDNLLECGKSNKKSELFVWHIPLIV